MITHRTLAAIAMAALIFVTLGGRAQAGEKYSQARVSIETRADLVKLKSLKLDEVYSGDKFIDVIVSPAELQELAGSGLHYQLSIEDMTAFFRSRFDPSKSMGGYRTLSEIELVMDSIATAKPAIVKPKWSIGNTLEGRPIYVMKISDNPAVDESEPELYYYAAHHAREVITPEVLIYFMRYLTNNYGTNAQVTFLVDNRELFFSPCMNPDGYYFNEAETPAGGGLWRKNRRNNGNGTYGVDLNRNYGYEWGFDDVGSSPDGSQETYRGSGPFSEPETQVEKAFIESRNFVFTLSYHSYSDYFLYPWGYDELYTPDDDIFSAMADTIVAMAGYTAGPPWQILYTVNGSSDDWGYGEQSTKNKNFAMTIEVGSNSDNFWPPTNRITPLVQKNLNPNLFLARIADHPQKLRGPAQPVIYNQPDIAVSDFDLYWHHQDLDNPAQAFEIWQLTGYSQSADNLESVSGNWLLNGFTSSTVRAVSGTKSYFSGNASNSNTRFTATNEHHVNPGDSLKCQIWYDTESGYDYAYAEVSTNGGTSWTSLAGNVTTIANPHGLNAGNGITGTSSAWVAAKFNLAPFLNQDILIRFRYTSDGFVNGAGVWIDDIYPTDSYSGQTQLSALETDTTIHVSGLTNNDYYYRVRARDAENQYSAYSKLEKVTVNIPPACTWLVGDANGSGAYSISDAVYLVQYVFGGGLAPTPDPIGSGDANCSGSITISDVVYMIQYVFSGGAAPGATCDCTTYLK